MRRGGRLTALLVATLSVGCGGSRYFGLGSDDSVPLATAACMAPAKREAQIREIYAHWHGTRHRMGGDDDAGLDCAAFAQTVYADAFGIELPRTTNALLGHGAVVPRAELTAGDLVFFRPDSYPRHVGVYLGRGEFTHVSAKKGVMLSRLDRGYWSKHYWTARRVIDAGACDH